MNRLKILNDFAFQKALGEKGDEPQLLAFLNAVLERTGKNNLESLEILEAKDLLADIFGGKAGKLDALAKLSNGSKANVEAQIRNQQNIEKRSLFYWSRLYTGNLGRGENYAGLLPVIGINIIDFERGPVEDFQTSYHLWEDRHKDVMMTDVCEIHFLDMVKFRRMENKDLGNPLHRWLIYFDEHSEEGLVREVVKMDGAIQLTQEKLDMIARDPEMRRAYERYEKAEWDYNSGINGARREGRRDERWDIAQKMKADNVPLEQIAKYTGLSAQQLMGL